MRTAGNAIRRGDVFDIALPCGDETVSCKVLVLQNDIANRVAPTVIVTPLVEGVPDNLPSRCRCRRVMRMDWDLII